VPTLDSDEAMLGLMARHLSHGEWSVFLWGQYYMGSLESILSAPILAIFGSSSITLRIIPLLFALAFIASIGLLGSWLIFYLAILFSGARSVAARHRTIKSGWDC
jgi:hypothetical protein